MNYVWKTDHHVVDNAKLSTSEDLLTKRNIHIPEEKYHLRDKAVIQLLYEENQDMKTRWIPLTAGLQTFSIKNRPEWKTKATEAKTRYRKYYMTYNHARIKRVAKDHHRGEKIGK